MSRSCDVCGKPYEAKRPNSRYCSDTCRKRKQRKPDAVDPVEAAIHEAVTGATIRESPLMEATRAELEAAGVLDTMLGQAAMALAAEIGKPFQTGAANASMVKELRATMAAALDNAQPVASPMDMLRARRDAKRGA